MGISPSTVFHFTNKSGLKGILEDNFHIKYCKELFLHPGIHEYIGIPMVSFCDIKVSELKEHIGKYGKYGIGLSKKWAKEKGLNPVFYINEDCPFAINLSPAIVELVTSKKLSFRQMNGIAGIYRYIKKYEGEFKRNNEIIPTLSIC